MRIGSIHDTKTVTVAVLNFGLEKILNTRLLLYNSHSGCIPVFQGFSSYLKNIPIFFTLCNDILWLSECLEQFFWRGLSPAPCTQNNTWIHKESYQHNWAETMFRCGTMFYKALFSCRSQVTTNTSREMVYIFTFPWKVSSLI